MSALVHDQERGLYLELEGGQKFTRKQIEAAIIDARERERLVEAFGPSWLQVKTKLESNQAQGIL